tara:strand:- start:958 stop:1350 length:393 start_codon:yes stop_codon:yes gene_type:complete
MKGNRFICAIVIVSSLFFACSKDSNNDVESEISADLLIGEWQFDSDPGYGDPTFYGNGRVEFHYFKEAWGDDFSEWGDWTLKESNLKIFWEDTDPDLEIYDTNIIKLTKTNLLWKVVIDGEMREESFTKK